MVISFLEIWVFLSLNQSIHFSNNLMLLSRDDVLFLIVRLRVCEQIWIWKFVRIISLLLKSKFWVIGTPIFGFRCLSWFKKSFFHRFSFYLRCSRWFLSVRIRRLRVFFCWADDVLLLFRLAPEFIDITLFFLAWWPCFSLVGLFVDVPLHKLQLHLRSSWVNFNFVFERELLHVVQPPKALLFEKIYGLVISESHNLGDLYFVVSFHCLNEFLHQCRAKTLN